MGSCENVKNGKKLEEMVRKIEEEFWVPVELLKELSDDMVLMMQKGLEDEESSSIKMLVSYVDSLPSGHEEGCFYALDLGGTNLRVMQVKLQGNRTIELKAESYMVPPKIKIGKLHELFDYIAEKVSHVFESVKADFDTVPGKKRELGFTFSFPVHQTRINSGTLLDWTKDYDAKDAIGKDMVVELSKALEKRAIDVNVTALLNDTVGTLAGGRFNNKNVVAAVILGTGMNAAYIEQSERILKPYGLPPKSGQMVINTEWGNFNSSLLPLTDYDCALDSDSPNHHKQILEKMLSGRYLGEIVRRILLSLADDAALFGDIVPPKLRQPYVLGTDIVSAMHGDKSTDLSVVGKCLEKVLEITNVSLEKKKVVVKICEVVATRGARLSAFAILSILKMLGKDKTSAGETVVAIDGSLFGKYEEFKLCLQKTLADELLDEEVSKMVVLRQFKDASGIGAAVVAASQSIYD
ncbi:hexokinase-2-like [Chenopodium quinoa]|uniref:Phosphotransferase n=1 Tax=Chenopodium quinoa TaxID=63459 RepID=A0A803MLX1_CHEQI|nr:hexokinase-2-like [Chenopodium quinoa]